MCMCNYRSAAAARNLASKNVLREQLDPLAINTVASCQNTPMSDDIVKCFKCEAGEIITLNQGDRKRDDHTDGN